MSDPRFKLQTFRTDTNVLRTELTKQKFAQIIDLRYHFITGNQLHNFTDASQACGAHFHIYAPRRRSYWRGISSTNGGTPWTVAAILYVNQNQTRNSKCKANALNRSIHNQNFTFTMNEKLSLRHYRKLA